MPILLFIAFFCIGLALRQGALMDPDTGWHIAAGDHIRAIGAIPETDPWSFTAGDYPWYNMSWAYDVAMSFVHSAGGLSAVVVVTVFLYALTVAATGAIALRSSGSIIASLFVAALSGFVLMPGMLARPQTLTFLLIVGFYAILRFGGPRLSFLLPLLTIAWANIHGAFLTGWVIVGAFFIEALAARDFRRSARLCAVGLLCVAAPLVNPYGWHVLDAARLAMTSEMRDLIVEWRPIVIGPADLPASLLLAVFVIGSALYERRIPLADKLLACFWLAVGLMSSRMMHIAAMLCAPYVAQAVALRLRESPLGAAIKARDLSYGADLSRRGVRIALASVALLLVGGALTPPGQRALAGGEAFASFPADLSPEGAMAFAREHYPNARLYNEYGLGGYIIYRLRGAPAVFFDGRVEPAYPREVMRDGIAIGYMDPSKRADPADDAEWRRLLDKYGVDGFLVSDRTRLHAILSRRPEWTKVFEDDAAAVFVRADLARG